MSSSQDSPPSDSSSSSNDSKSESPTSNNDSSSGKNNNSSPSNDNNNNNSNGNNNSNSSSPPSPPPNNNGGNNNNNNSPPSNNNGGNNNNNNSPPNNNNGGNNNNNNSPPSNNNNNDSNNNNNNSPPSNNNNDGNNNNNKSPPPPKSLDSSKSAPPPPPPPQSSSHSPPTSKSLSPPKHQPTKSSENKNENKNALRIGVAVGAAVLFLVVVICIVCCCKRKKRRKHGHQMGYYRDTSRHGDMSNEYYNNNTRQHGNWQNNNKLQGSDQFVKMPPPPGSAAVSSEMNWAIAPPPPPPMMSSSTMSSAAFSGPALPPPHPAMALGFNQSSFSYEDLAAATGSFAKANLLGQGGFGYVHKGVLPNGKEVAVKSLKSNSGQGEREFQAEVEMLSRVHHRHLVSLAGYCIAGSQRMLVYEFIQNNTLEYHLHGSGRPPMDFSSRHRIALGAAKGFAYLHEDCHPKIIHRDIKAANILLDENFEAKVADFGLAKLSSDTNTHVSTRIMGTFGYLAPEYASSGKLTEKSDVYSYGVMLLELITGRRPIDLDGEDEDTLVEWARPILLRATEGGNYDQLIDARLEGKFDAQQMLCMVACAAATIRHSAKRRPKMSQIVRALEDEVTLDDLNEGGKLGHSNTLSSGSEHDGGSYDLKKFKKSSMSSQEYSSGEFRQNKNPTPTP